MARGDLTGEQWALIEPHLPIAEVGPIPDLRKHFNAVMWRFRVGSPWRDLPAEFGPWQSAYDRFRIWAKQGVFQQLMEAVIAEPRPVARPTWVWSAWTRRPHGPTTTPPGWPWTPNNWRPWRLPPRPKKGRHKGTAAAGRTG